MRKNCFTFITFLLFLSPFIQAKAPISAGLGFFQTDNRDDTFNPLTAAPEKVSTTSTSQNPSALQSPFRTRSWLGGMLWGTGATESDYNIYCAGWANQILEQHPAWADPIILMYTNPPNTPNPCPHSTPPPVSATGRGVRITAAFPYLQEDASYDTTCGSASSAWDTAPLQLKADAINNILLIPVKSAPSNDTDPVPAIWAPNGLLVDRMGDFDADIIYQDPSNPYVYSAFSDTGSGEYLKTTIAQGSPFVFCESLGTRYVVIQNNMQGSGATGVKIATTTPAPVPGVSNVSYALIAGNQNNPGIFAGAGSLNETEMQDNFTTWAVFFKTDEATINGSFAGTTNNVLEFNNEGESKNWFIIAQIPTIMAYPTASETYATAVGTSADTYAKELGKIAFNFFTNTTVSYSVTDMYLVETTFDVTLENPYDDSSMVSSTETVLALQPHQYQDVSYASGVTPTVLNLNGSSDFAPSTTPTLNYWSIRGNLKTIQGTTFVTNYIFNNFLPSMPTPDWDTTFTSASGFSSTIGQFLFDLVDNQYITNVNTAFAPWNTAYATLNKGIYDVGKSLSMNSKQLGTILQMIQLQESEGSLPWTEAQYNNRPDLPDRPGGSITKSLKSSVASLAGAIAGSINLKTKTLEGYFQKTPISTPFLMGAQKTGFSLDHFGCYDKDAHTVNLYPTSAAPSVNTGTNMGIWPSTSLHPPTHPGIDSPGNLWQAFGVSSMMNDHHYQYGYWISTAALLTLFDGAEKSKTPRTGIGIFNQGNYGACIDQLVMDLAFDSSVTSFWNVSGMSFAKMQFFDQWAGHGWADGLQATLAGGSGHNENSIQEANQAYASIILWGMATGRLDIAQLGIYLYTTATYAADLYFYDKNLNLKPGNSFSFVPVAATTNPTYDGKSFWDMTIPQQTGGSTSASGFPKLSQSILNYSTDFGQTPPNVLYINAFPCTPWTMAIGRGTIFGGSTNYLNAWNESWQTADFDTLISSTANNCWEVSYYSNMNMLGALGGSTQGYGTSSSKTPLQQYIDLIAINGNTPPFGLSTQYNDPSQGFPDTLQFLHTMDAYGMPDWSLYANDVSNPSTTMLFSAAFNNGSTTTYFAFNPDSESTINVQFYDITTNTAQLSTPLAVKPKRWSMTQTTP